MGNFWGRTWSAVTHVVSADDKAAATVEDVCFEVNGPFYFHEKSLISTLQYIYDISLCESVQ